MMNTRKLDYLLDGMKTDLGKAWLITRVIENKADIPSKYIDKAIEIFRKEGDMNQDYILLEHYNNLKERGKHEKAMEGYLQWGNPISLTYAARCAEELGEDEKAQQLYAQAINDDINNGIDELDDCVDLIETAENITDPTLKKELVLKILKHRISQNVPNIEKPGYYHGYETDNRQFIDATILEVAESYELENELLGFCEQEGHYRMGIELSGSLDQDGKEFKTKMFEEYKKENMLEDAITLAEELGITEGIEELKVALKYQIENALVYDFEHMVSYDLNMKDYQRELAEGKLTYYEDMNIEIGNEKQLVAALRTLLKFDVDEERAEKLRAYPEKSLIWTKQYQFLDKNNIEILEENGYTLEAARMARVLGQEGRAKELYYSLIDENKELIKETPTRDERKWIYIRNAAIAKELGDKGLVGWYYQKAEYWHASAEYLEKINFFQSAAINYERFGLFKEAEECMFKLIRSYGKITRNSIGRAQKIVNRGEAIEKIEISINHEYSDPFTLQNINANIELNPELLKNIRRAKRSMENEIKHEERFKFYQEIDQFLEDICTEVKREPYDLSQESGISNLNQDNEPNYESFELKSGMKGPGFINMGCEHGTVLMELTEDDLISTEDELVLTDDEKMDRKSLAFAKNIKDSMEWNLHN